MVPDNKDLNRANCGQEPMKLTPNMTTLFTTLEFSGDVRVWYVEDTIPRDSARREDWIAARCGGAIFG